jgi:retron-type reverse transcriptase
MQVFVRGGEGAYLRKRLRRRIKKSRKEKENDTEAGRTKQQQLYNTLHSTTQHSTPANSSPSPILRHIALCFIR